MTDISARDAGIAVVKAIANKLEAMKADLARLQKAEAEGMPLVLKKSEVRKSVFQVLSKSVSDTKPASDYFKKLDVKKQAKAAQKGPLMPEASKADASKPLVKPGESFVNFGKPAKKAETFISNDHPADPEKRDVTKGKPGPTLPGERKEKVVPQPGSGGEMKKADGDPTAKPAMPAKPPVAKTGAMPKPAGIPGAKVGAAPSIPKPPKAPGSAGMTAKSEVGVFAKLKMKKGQ